MNPNAGGANFGLESTPSMDSLRVGEEWLSIRRTESFRCSRGPLQERKDRNREERGL